ncbi:MAG: hypothetical protein WBP72_05835 [Rhodocyclaceae bacterium]
MIEHTPEVPTRSAWRRQRDAANVSKGAAKVSIGDALDEFHKSWNARKLDGNLIDTRQLLASLDTYVATIRKKNPKFASEVEKIRRKVDVHKGILEDVVKAKTSYYPTYAEIAKGFVKVKLRAADAPTPKDLTPAITKLKGLIDTMGLVDSSLEEKHKTMRGLFLNFDGGNLKEWRKSEDDDSVVQDIEKKLDALKP